MNRQQRRAKMRKFSHLKFTSIDQAKRFLIAQNLTKYKKAGEWQPIENASPQEIVDIMHHNFGCYIHQNPKDEQEKPEMPNIKTTLVP